MKVGIGYDVHRLAPGQKLVLGGVEVASCKGLIGWSDADVLVHAVIDALLGAAAMGDIGQHFSPGDPKYKGISSLKLLKTVLGMLARDGWHAGNIDATIVAEEPRLKDYIPKMRKSLAKALGLDIGLVSVKASTSEQLGFAGRGEGIVVWAVASIKSDKE